MELARKNHVRRPPICVNIREAVQISPLKGDKVSAQGYGLGNSRRCAEGAPYCAAQYRIEIIRARLCTLTPLAGRIFAWRAPRAKLLSQLPGARRCALRDVDAHERSPKSQPGFGVRQFKAMCPEGAPYSAAPYRIEIIRARLFTLTPLSGRIFAWRAPWAKLFCPFGAQTLCPSLC